MAFYLVQHSRAAIQYISNINYAALLLHCIVMQMKRTLFSLMNCLKDLSGFIIANINETVSGS